VTLRQLCVFGRNWSLSKALRSANYVRNELAVRLAHRIRDFQRLPFIVGLNPHIQAVYKLYWEAFDSFREVGEITTAEENIKYCELLKRFLNKHLVVIPQLAMGIVESASHMTPVQVDKFMNEMLRSRISRRVLAEQHICLSSDTPQPEGYIGIVNTKVGAASTVEKCAHLATLLMEEEGLDAPHVCIDGALNATFPYIPDHIEYIIYEILKNSMRFTVLTHSHKIRPIQGHAPLSSSPIKSDTISTVSNVLNTRPVEGNPSHTTIEERKIHKVEYSRDSPLDQPLYSHENNIHSSSSSSSSSSFSSPSGGIIDDSDSHLPDIHVTIAESEKDITFRISDQGGGIPNEIYQNLWSYSHRSKRKFLDFDKMPFMAGKVDEGVKMHLGIGLPMSKVYANYWGGGITISTMPGWGTDVYVRVPKLGNQLEHLSYDESSNI